MEEGEEEETEKEETEKEMSQKQISSTEVCEAIGSVSAFSLIIACVVF